MMISRWCQKLKNEEEHDSLSAYGYMIHVKGPDGELPVCKVRGNIVLFTEDA